MKFTLHTNAVNGGAFNCRPAGSFELDGEKILCNDINFPKNIDARSFNPHNIRLWVIGNEFGALGAVWADCEQNAFDNLVDAGLGDSFLVDTDDLKSMSEAERESLANLGNSSEYCDLTNAWLCTVSFEPARDFVLLMALAEAKGACADNLDKI